LRIETANLTLDQAAAASLRGTAPGPYVWMAIRDTGQGMDAATQARIFEPFFTTKAVGKGTGLGLASVYGIVKQSGGAIFVQSEPGLGSVFHVYLPQMTGRAATPRATDPAAPASGGSETILLVEDEDAVRNLLGEILQDAGYRVLAARNGPEAIACSDRHKEPIHLLLTDVVMPKMNGRELADRLVALRPATKVLYVSGYTDDALGPDTGAAPRALLLKPVEAGPLLRKVREVLDT
ncbi:MAG: response regulator, partial [Alphaproteobacteria bacterium]|nr:response regulator [Alphaproteobacteria bacterium]